MKKLYVALQSKYKNKWVVVGMLEKDGHNYKFSYTKGSTSIEGFRRFGSMNNNVTLSEELFPFFVNRILSKARPEYAKLLEWMNIDGDECDSFDMLALTEGKRGTDEIELFACPMPVDGRFSVTFFAHGVRHTHIANQEGLSVVNSGSSIFLMKDFQNTFDTKAIALRTNDPACLLGYLPRYLAVDIHKLCEYLKPEQIKVSIVRINPDAPLSFKFLCKLDAPWPMGFNPCSEEEYQLLS